MLLYLPAIVLYLLASALLVRALALGRADTMGWRVPAWLAIALHACYHGWVAWHLQGGPDMHFFAALSLVSLGMAGLTALVSGPGRTSALGVVSFPLAAVLLGAYHAYGHRPTLGLDWRLQLHAWLALLAYATLAVAALLAIMLWLQERALRRREFHRWMRALPPLTELEDLLFRTIGVGFVLLTGTLLTGLLFVHDLLGQHLIHKTVLSVLSWLLFGGLLLGRWRHGWRGSRAVGLTLAAMGLLVLAFFGSKAVLELVLHRTV